MKKLFLMSLLILSMSGLSWAAPSTYQYITPSVSIPRGGVISNSGTTCNGQVNQTLAYVGATVVKGVEVGASGTAQCVALTDISNCQGATGNGVTGSIFEACAAANTATYYDFSNSPIRVVNGIVVTTSRTDGFATVYTQ